VGSYRKNRKQHRPSKGAKTGRGSMQCHLCETVSCAHMHKEKCENVCQNGSSSYLKIANKVLLLFFYTFPYLFHEHVLKQGYFTVIKTIIIFYSSKILWCEHLYKYTKIGNQSIAKNVKIQSSLQIYYRTESSHEMYQKYILNIWLF
jgi:hypothetical protein